MNNAGPMSMQADTMGSSEQGCTPEEMAEFEAMLTPRFLELFAKISPEAAEELYSLSLPGEIGQLPPPTGGMPAAPPPVDAMLPKPPGLTPAQPPMPPMPMPAAPPPAMPPAGGGGGQPMPPGGAGSLSQQRIPPKQPMPTR